MSGYDTVKVAEYDTVHGWKNRSQNLPNVPVSSIVQDTSNGYLYIGTDVGVFYRGDTMTMWHSYNNGMPVVRSSDLGINYTTGEIWAATYGRGMWKSVKYTKPTGISIVPFLPDILTVSPNPNHGDFSISTTYANNEQAAIQIFDNNGRAVWQRENNFEAGRMQVHTTGLARGNYIINISTYKGSIGRQKLVVY
jgi:xyloglucan-specific exo-beta-1,4-glucanase